MRAILRNLLHTLKVIRISQITGYEYIYDTYICTIKLLKNDFLNGPHYFIFKFKYITFQKQSKCISVWKYNTMLYKLKFVCKWYSIYLLYSFEHYTFGTLK